jgi:muramoyltetrapeptide carboxypeptidase
MIRALDRAGKLAHLKGLVVGGFTELKDNDIPFGFSVEEIILEVVSKYHYPVVFNFPAGHIQDNCALRLGEEVRVGRRNNFLSFIKKNSDLKEIFQVATIKMNFLIVMALVP